MSKNNDSTLKDFFSAALRGDSRALKRILYVSGPEILNAKGMDGRTALSFAAGQGNVSTVRYLLSAGADPDIADDAGRTPLHIAARVNQLSVFRCLKYAGANSKVRDHQGWSATHYAALGGNLPILRDIFRDGAVLEDRAADFTTPLHLAARSLQNRDAAFFLVDLGADSQARDRRGQTPMDMAVQASLPEVAEGITPAARDLRKQSRFFSCLFK